MDTLTALIAHGKATVVVPMFVLSTNKPPSYLRIGGGFVYCLALRRIRTVPSNIACIFRLSWLHQYHCITCYKKGLSPWKWRACVQGFLNWRFPSRDFLTLQLQFCYDAEWNSSLIPPVRKGARSSVVFRAESPSFQLSYLCTGFVFR